LRYFVELSYNGKAYHGWQIQPNAITVQEVLEKALTTVLREDITIVGAGRTDAGVHAKQLFAHFDIQTKIESEQLVFKLNAFLPKDIVITSVFEVKSEAHARFDALSRTYIYRVSKVKNVFNYDFTYLVKQHLDVQKMNAACEVLLAYNDFQCFSKTHTDVKTYICSIKKATWNIVDDELIFTITADRFLRNMVRAIVGTMINIGLGKLTHDDLHAIILSKDRSKAGFSVPAHGLYLTHVAYPEHILIEHG